MEQILEAVYTNGVLTPLEPLDLLEKQRVTITIRWPEPVSAQKSLVAWQQVYKGLSEDDINEIEQIALDRSNFMPQV